MAPALAHTAATWGPAQCDFNRTPDHVRPPAPTSAEPAGPQVLLRAWLAIPAVWLSMAIPSLRPQRGPAQAKALEEGGKGDLAARHLDRYLLAPR